MLEFEYCDVPEQWLEDDDDGAGKLWDGTTATVLGNGATPSALGPAAVSHAAGDLVRRRLVLRLLHPPGRVASLVLVRAAVVEPAAGGRKSSTHRRSVFVSSTNRLLC